MNKYLEVFKVGFQEMVAYRFDVFGTVVFSFFRILLAFLLWQAIFREHTEIGGFTFNMMITYYIIVSVLLMLDKSQEVSETFSEEIRNGQFSKYVVKPIKPIGYYFSLVLSKFAYVLGFNILAIIIWALLFNEYFIVAEDIGVYLSSAFLFLLGLFFMALLNYFFTILAFWILEVSAFFMIKDHVIEFLSGSLIPLSLLPASVLFVSKFFPFYYVYYYPVSLYLGKEDVSFTFAFGVLFAWIFVFFLLNDWLYRKAIKSFDGVGI